MRVVWCEACVRVLASDSYRGRSEDAEAAERLRLEALHARAESGRARRAREGAGELGLRRERHVQRELRIQEGGGATLVFGRLER